MKDKFNFNFDENDVPVGVGDRYYAQDMIRDSRYLQNLPLQILSETLNVRNIIIRGLQVSKSASNIISLTKGSGMCNYMVKIPDDSKEWSVPPQTTFIDILTLINIEAQAIQLEDSMLNNIKHYIKVKYKEEEINHRARQNIGGSYSYVVSDSYEIIIDTNPPNNYELLLGTFTGNGVELTVDSISTENKTYMTDIIYPIGSIYWSGVATNPHDLFGGTWVQIKDRFVLACGDTYANGATGGAATVKLTEPNLPAHTHTVTVGNVSNTGSTWEHTHTYHETHKDTSNGYGGTGSGTYINHSWPQTSSTNLQHTHSASCAYTGGNTAHENMPPYIVKYCWQRTA